MLGFWETKMRNRGMLKYSFALFLEEAGTLLLEAKNLWHPWSVNRTEELLRISYELQHRAKELRRNGLAWASNISEFGQNPAYLLSTSVYYRYHNNNEENAPHPEAAPYMVATAVKILFILLPAFQKVENMSFEEKGLVRWLSEIIEILMEAPYNDSAIEISENTLKAVVSHAIFIECEGLAYMQATIEDTYGRAHKDTRGKVKSELSNEELQKLADKTDVPFGDLKEALETECSSWWNKCDEYRNRAAEQKEHFLCYLTEYPGIRQGIRNVLDSGSTTKDSTLFQISKREMDGAEGIIQSFILLFLNFADSGWEKEYTALKSA